MNRMMDIIRIEEGWMNNRRKIDEEQVYKRVDGQKNRMMDIK